MTITDLENLQSLKSELLDLNQAAARSMSDVKNGKEATIDLHRWSDRKQRLEVQIPLAEAKVLNQQIRSLKVEREQAKAELDRLRPKLEEAAILYDQKLQELQAAFEAHALIQVQSWNAEQTYQQAYEDWSDRKTELRTLIQSVTGVEEVRPDGLSNTNTNNLLIRN